MVKPDPSTLHKLYIQAVRDHNVLPLTGRCNLRCCFCSHGQNPPGSQAFDFPPLNLSLIEELIPFLRSDAKIIIGESATRLREGEPLTHPQFSQIIDKVRSCFPTAPIQVTTNASLLTPQIVGQLACLQPLELILSLNSATARGRHLLMGDKNPAQALNAVELLLASGLTFHGSVVAMPHLTGWEDLKDTLLFLDKRGARTLRLLLPGFTRCSDLAFRPPMDLWENCRDFSRKLMKQLTAPLTVEPPAIADLDPVIDGVMAGTPAAGAGLLPGDQIFMVNGKAPMSRVEAFNLVRERANPRLKLGRGGQVIEKTLIKDQGQSPGFVVSYDLDPAQVERVRRFLLTGADTLMLTSTGALDRWRLAAVKFKLEGLRLAAVPAKFFGGNIQSAGLLTTADFLETIIEETPAAVPRHILLPAIAYDDSGLDLAGESYRTLLEQGLPIVLVD